MIMSYQYLTADQCEELKRNVDVNAPWGSYGLSGRDALKYRPLIELDTNHLENILITQPQITPAYRATILHILKSRYQAN